MPAWIVRATAGIDIKIRDIAFCSTYTKWVAIGLKISDGSSVAMESSDGFSWNILVTGFEASTPFRAVRGIDLPVSRGLVVICTNDKIIELQQNGTWTEVVSGITTSILDRMEYLPGVGFCLMHVTTNQVNVRVSNDGVTWLGPVTVVNNALVATSNVRLAIRQGLYFLILLTNSGAQSINRFYNSADGTTWGQLGDATSFTNLIGIVFPPGLIVVSGRQTGDLANKAFGGESSFFIWTLLSTITGGGAFVQYNSLINKIIAIDVGGSSAISSDGVSWEIKGHPAITGFTAFTGEDTLVGSDDYLLMMKGDAGYDFTNFTEDPVITEPTNLDTSPGAGADEVDITFNSDNPSGEEIDGYAIIRTDADGNSTIVATLVNDGTPTSHSFTDTLPLGIASPVTYTIIAYSAQNLTKSSPISQQFVIPDITIVGSGGIDFGGTAPTVFILNPSGIYTIVSGKRHDTLYERMTGISSQNVKIPNPFGKTAYVGSNNE